MHNPFTKHPKKVGENYFQHFAKSIFFCFTFLLLAFTSLIHAIFPFLFEYFGSNKIKELHEYMQKRKEKTTNKN